MEKVSHCCSCVFKNIYRKPLSRWNNNGLIRLQRVPTHREISYSRFPLFKFARTGYGKGVEARVEAEVDEESVEYVQTNDLKFSKHPGAFSVGQVQLPEKFVDAVQILSSHEDRPKIVKGAAELRNYLWSRQAPIEQTEYRAAVSKVEDEVERYENVLTPFLSENEMAKLDKKRDKEILKRLRKEVYHWTPIRYTMQRAWEYVFARSAGDYASLYRIFNEIAKRDPEFQPKTMCDFGSGVGTVSWAAREFWSSSLVEHLCADISGEMNDLAELILRGGCRNNDHPIPALFFRSHLPESYKIRYDLVVSAFSLLELPSARARLETIDKLWKKTENYLVIVEPGTMAGFKIVQEARDYILGMGSRSDHRPKCFVFSPCSHKMECPRMQFDNIPCNFEVKYRGIYPFRHDNTLADRFTYVVIRRGYPSPDEKMWPRLVEQPMLRKGHIICRLCTKNGQLSEFILTKSRNSQSERLMAKRSKWGDLLPIHIKDEASDLAINEQKHQDEG